MPHCMILLILYINLLNLSKDTKQMSIFFRNMKPLTRVIIKFSSHHYINICVITRETYLVTCASNEDSNQPVYSRSLISLRWPHEETLHGYPPMPILIRLRESLLGEYFRRYVF